MAKVKDPLHSLEASGTIGGITFQDWRGLGVVREKPIPTIPRTPRQTGVWSIVSDISRYWANTLNEGQRQAWKNFADNFVWTDIFGRELRLTGINLFVKMNFQLQDHEVALQVTPPPPVLPPEVVIKGITNQNGGVIIDLTEITEAQITAQAPFLDIWTAGAWEIGLIDISGTGININLRGTGLPQGVNPVLSDFRHRLYITEEIFTTPPGVKEVKIFYGDPDGNPFSHPYKIETLIRRYNKHGQFSTTQTVSLINTTA